jgi:hypothetical protein
MPLYRCPCCQNLSLAWDSRSRAFVCTSDSCNEAIRPAEESLALALSTGRVVVNQQWLDRQPISSHCGTSLTPGPTARSDGATS